MAKKIKAIHALNWYFGNICVTKCPEDLQMDHYEEMREIIKDHEDYLITHKMFIKIMHEKHNVCGLTDEKLRRPNKNFWRLDCLW